MHGNSEKQVETAIKRYVNAQPCSFVVKLHGGAVTGRGYLDLFGSLHGVPFWVEVKAPGGAVRREQLLWVREARRGGYVSGVADSLEAFQALFDATADEKENA
jgi:hypothetical protein